MQPKSWPFDLKMNRLRICITTSCGIGTLDFYFIRSYSHNILVFQLFIALSYRKELGCVWGCETGRLEEWIRLFVFVMHSWWDRRNCEHEVISPIVKPVAPRMHNKNEVGNCNWPEESGNVFAKYSIFWFFSCKRRGEWVLNATQNNEFGSSPRQSKAKHKYTIDDRDKPT